MSRLQTIENALKNINETVFQELCDSFLAIRNENYAAFSRVGSQSGKQKTVLGTPDSLLLLPSGKYLFIEYSTNVTKGLIKLKDDVIKCLDTSKTGISVNEILEIILCINFNLKPFQVEELRLLLKDTRIRLTIISLDSLSIELHLNHRDLAHHYLGLPLDTGQVVSIEQFIKEYDRASKSISTPLDNVFVHRAEELKLLKQSLFKSDFIILTGPPGIGKTKLVIETIHQYLEENLEYNAYCISYKSFSLLDDLYQYLNLDKDYILFVDDANRIDAFNQIIGFYKTDRKGKLKIIITVRDYAYQEIGRLCQDLLPIRIDLARLTDQMITDIIKSDSFQILNQRYQKEIVRIADGNPRLAIMAALLANAHQNLSILHDVSDLFEKYFSTFIKDQEEFAANINIKCLGLIGFFYTIPYKDRELVIPILVHFNIEYSQFLDVIDSLDRLELVEIQFEHVKIPEQNLAIYFFYKSFIKDDLLSFWTLLKHYFEFNKQRFRECVISANNTFGPEKVMNKLKPDLIRYWNLINVNDEKAYEFLNIFWFYLQLETLEYLINKVNVLPIAHSSKYVVTYDNNAFSYKKDKIIELLGEYFRTVDSLNDTLALSFRYVIKSPEHLPELIFKIREVLIFDWGDEQNDFVRQQILFDFLLKNIDLNSQLYPLVFFELAKTFMGYQFQHSEGGRNHAISIYRYPLPNIKSIQDFRLKIWATVDRIFPYYSQFAFEFLESYALISPDVEKEIMAFDVPHLIDVIEKHLTNQSFEHCKYVQDQIRWCKRMEIYNERFNALGQKFTNSIYETYLKIDWNRLRDKEMFEFDNYSEYEKLKESEIRTSFVFYSTDQIAPFYGDFVYLKKEAKNDWSYNNTLEIIISENFKASFDLGYEFYNIIIQNDNEISYVPRISLKNQLIETNHIEQLWQLITKHNFKHQTAWKLSFFDFLDDSAISTKNIDDLLSTINSVNEPITLHFDGLQKYLKVNQYLFKDILSIIIQKNANGGEIRTWMDFFSSHFDELGDDLELIKIAYLQQYKIQSHFDFEAQAFLNILQKDPNFLVEYINSQFSDRDFGHDRYHRNLSFIWNIAGIENPLLKVFDLFVKNGHYYGILETYLNTFFKIIKDDDKLKADNFLVNYVRENYKDYNKINLVVDIVRHSRRELFEQILLYYISLNQNVDDFAKIWWRGNGGTYSGNVIMGDIEAADWRNILSIVEKSEVGIDLIPIKKYILNTIESCLQSGDWERKRRFIERD